MLKCLELDWNLPELGGQIDFLASVVGRCLNEIAAPFH